MRFTLYTFLFCLFFFSQQSIAQDYDSALGFRIGFPTSISYKKFVVEDKAFELHGGWRSRTDFNEIRLNAAYLFHKQIGDIDFFNWYWGFGGGGTFYILDPSILADGRPSIQANGYLGIEYTLEGVPIQLSIDWIPTLSIGGFNKGLQGGIGGVAIRYILSN